MCNEQLHASSQRPTIQRDNYCNIRQSESIYGRVRQQTSIVYKFPRQEQRVSTNEETYETFQKIWMADDSSANVIFGLFFSPIFFPFRNLAPSLKREWRNTHTTHQLFFFLINSTLMGKSEFDKFLHFHRINAQIWALPISAYAYNESLAL